MSSQFWDPLGFQRLCFFICGFTWHNSLSLRLNSFLLVSVRILNLRLGQMILRSSPFSSPIPFWVYDHQNAHHPTLSRVCDQIFEGWICIYSHSSRTRRRSFVSSLRCSGCSALINAPSRFYGSNSSNIQIVCCFLDCTGSIARSARSAFDGLKDAQSDQLRARQGHQVSSDEYGIWILQSSPCRPERPRSRPVNASGLYSLSADDLRKP